MRYRVVITDKAWSGLFEIGKRIKLDNPSRAETFVAELYDGCNSLQDFPETHGLIVDPKRRGVRRAVHGDYLILFRVLGAVVEVLLVLHGARDYQRLLFPDDEG
jgi:toxin ParE1/3/4